MLLHSLRLFIFSTVRIQKIKRELLDIITNIDQQNKTKNLLNFKHATVLNAPNVNIFFCCLIICMIFNCSCGKNETALSGFTNNQEVALKTKNGLYLCADRSKSNQLFTNRKSVGDWETFSIILLGGDKIALKSKDDFYWSYDKNGCILANNSILNEGSVLTAITAGSGYYIFKSNMNKFISVNSATALIANQDLTSNAESFCLEAVTKYSNANLSFVQLIPFILALLFLFVSLILFQINSKHQISIILLLLGALCIRIFIVLLSPNLHWWDEQFHALVAKNMIDNPFKPMLYQNPVLPSDYRSWVSGHVWLHKQPLFLWQMALSLKLFGINTFALRLPSVLMSTAVAFFIYRIGKVTVNKTAAYFAAFLFTLSNFSFEIAGGAMVTDHNDVAFLFYVCASVWAWIEYEQANAARKKYFLIAIGLFSGCAVLVKWLVGLLVYSGWGLAIILLRERRKSWIHYKHLMFSFVISVLVFLPWQIYIFNKFPLESKFEFLLNIKHLYEVIENHIGDFWFHFNMAEKIYRVHFLLILICLILFFRAVRIKVYKIAIFTYIILIYSFYTVAATKMIAFTYCISFLVFLSMGAFLDKYFKILILNAEYFPLKIHKIFYTTVVIIILSGFNINYERIREIHTNFRKDELSHLSQRLRTVPIINNLSSVIPNIQEYVIFNCRDEDNIPIMFFNNVVAAYSPIPNYETINEIKQKGYKIAVFQDDKLPDYIKNDLSVLKIDEGYWK